MYVCVPVNASESNNLQNALECTTKSDRPTVMMIVDADVHLLPLSVSLHNN